MRHLSFVLVTLGVAAGVLGCDKNGYPDLGEQLDVVVPCGQNSTTWIRSTCGTHPNGEDGHLVTEVLILGTDDFSAGATTQDGCFLHSKLYYDTSGDLWTGKMDGTGGTASALLGYHYGFLAEANKPVLSRRGSYRDQLLPPERYDFTYTSDGSTLTLTETATGDSKDFVNVVDLLASLDPTVQLDAYAFSRIFAIPIYHSFLRLLAYGSGGMTQYMTASEFSAAVSGTFRVHVTDALTKPKTILTYNQFEEFSGFYHDGEYITVTDFGGNGTSYGPLNFRFRNDPADATSFATGYVDYTDVDVVNGFGADGCYNFYYESNPAVIIPAQVFNSIDLSIVLPTDGSPAPDGGHACPMYDPWAGTPPATCPRM